MLVQVKVWTISRSIAGTYVMLQAVNQKEALSLPLSSKEAERLFELFNQNSNNLKMKPEIHDLFFNLIKTLKGRIDHLEISSDANREWNAKMYAHIENRTLIMDIKVIDALILALKSQCIILIDHKIMQKSSLNINQNQIYPASNHIHTQNQKELMNLQKKLNFLVDEENYEEAALLRDKINKLDK